MMLPLWYRVHKFILQCYEVCLVAEAFCEHFGGAELDKFFDGVIVETYVFCPLFCENV